ncbi:MAG: ATP-binding protein [Syntrophobacteraceae bacterium]
MIKIRRKISHRFFSAFFLVAVIPIVIMGIGMYRAAEDTLIDSAHMHIQTVAQDHAGRLDTWYGERLNDIRVLSGLSTVRELCRSVCSIDPEGVRAAQTGLMDNSLALTRGKSPAYQSIHVLSLSGQVLASTQADSEMLVTNKYLEDLESLKNADGPVLSPVHQHSNNAWYLHLTVPIYSDDGKISAAIMAILNALGTLDPLLSNRVGLGSTGEAYLVNGDGKIVTESRYLSREQTNKSHFQTSGIKSALNQEQGISIYRNYMGREVIGAYTWLPRYHSALLVEMGKDEILAPLRGIRVAVLSIAGLVSLICILASFLLSRQISKPITEMAKASRMMASGTLDQRISYSGHDEVGTLSESFNSMAEKVSVLVNSLKQKEVSLQNAYDDLLQTQEQLVQSERMAAIGELVASVVHEMRNPLSSVKLNFQIIGRTLDRAGPLHEHHQIGLGQIAQLETMFSSLLDYSKPISIEKRPFQLEAAVHEALYQLKPHTGDSEIVLSGVGDPLPSVMGDPEKIRQVIVNIVKNAVEAAGTGGRVEINTRAAEAGSRKEVILEVRDNGPGISPQDLKRIFQPFFTTRQKGTGLGLSIVRKIMEAHRFSISVASKEGSGTTVSLCMQCA